MEGTGNVILTLQNRGIDMIEVGIPFSDPLADGPVIQAAGTVALRNGMTLDILFNQLADIRDKVRIPLLLMGYLNVVMHYGVERFCERCVEAGVAKASKRDHERPIDTHRKNEGEMFVSAQTFQLD